MPQRSKRGYHGSRRLSRRAIRLPGIWLGHHLQGALASLGRLQRSPWPTIMTVAVIGIALALPGGLYVLTRNLVQLSGGWENTAAISLFLRTEVTWEQASVLAERLGERADLEEVQAIHPDEALQELRAQSGFAEAIEHLEENPLPVVLALRPMAGVDSPEGLEAMREMLASLPEVELARMDTRWIRRFQAIVTLAERGVLILGSVLSLGVLLVVGNTIRLEIENQRAEIHIMELVGATASFIRRPFLYTGAWYGLLGGLAAWALIGLALFLLQGPVTRLAALYHTDFAISGLGPTAFMSLLGGSVALGLLGSWLSVGRHLAAAEPG